MGAGLWQSFSSSSIFCFDVVIKAAKTPRKKLSPSKQTRGLQGSRVGWVLVAGLEAGTASHCLKEKLAHPAMRLSKNEIAIHSAVTKWKGKAQEKPWQCKPSVLCSVGSGVRLSKESDRLFWVCLYTSPNLMLQFQPLVQVRLTEAGSVQLYQIYESRHFLSPCISSFAHAWEGLVIIKATQVCVFVGGVWEECPFWNIIPWIMKLKHTIF